MTKTNYPLIIEAKPLVLRALLRANPRRVNHYPFFFRLTIGLPRIYYFEYDPFQYKLVGKYLVFDGVNTRDTTCRVCSITYFILNRVLYDD
jgi:hypothetical protein